MRRLRLGTAALALRGGADHAQAGSPYLIFDDLKNFQNGPYSTQTIGYEQAYGDVGSMALASNCVLAFGQAAGASAKTATYQINAYPIVLTLSALRFDFTPVGSPLHSGDIKHVGIVARA